MSSTAIHWPLWNFGDSEPVFGVLLAAVVFTVAGLGAAGLRSAFAVPGAAGAGGFDGLADATVVVSRPVSVLPPAWGSGEPPLLRMNANAPTIAAPATTAAPMAACERFGRPPLPPVGRRPLPLLPRSPDEPVAVAGVWSRAAAAVRRSAAGPTRVSRFARPWALWAPSVGG